MNIRAALATVAGKSSKLLLEKTRSGGSSMPGKVAMKIDPSILATLSADYRVIIVTGTNGKTMTTSMITKIFEEKYGQVLTNPTGANMLQGIVSCFLGAPRKKLGGTRFAILEVDEATLKYVTRYIKPEAVVFTNLFRDQMDRYGEIYTTYRLMCEGVAQAPEATVIANGDLPIFSSVALENPFVYFGFDHEEDREQQAHYNTDGILCPKCDNILHYKLLTYSNLGKFYCPYCDFKRPALAHAVTAIHSLSPESSSFAIDGVDFSLPIAGMYNIYNALAAYSVAKHFGISDQYIKRGFEASKRIFGRQEHIHIGDKDVVMNLIKNPVGYNQIVAMLATDPEPFSVVAILNDRHADGTDVSWIWDGDFEQLVQITKGRPFFLSGIRVAELSTRFEVAGLGDDEKIINQDLSAIAEWIKEAPTRKVYILATYTATLDLRRTFAEQGYIKEGMAI
ncbi:MAG: Mur ligase family protein [Peptococcaceae bacterium]|nr:Mur ligase family protein [Peptococcaceae bacterium]